MHHPRPRCLILDILCRVTLDLAPGSPRNHIAERHIKRQLSLREFDRIGMRGYNVG